VNEVEVFVINKNLCYEIHSSLIVFDLHMVIEKLVAKNFKKAKNDNLPDGLCDLPAKKFVEVLKRFV